MANSRIGNYQLEFNFTGYDNPIRVHNHSIYVAPLTSPTPGTPVADIDLQQRGGGSIDVQSAVNQYAGFLRRFFATTVDMGNFTLWKFVTANSRDFVSAGVAVPGVNGVGSTQVAQQTTMTYRTAGGSILKQVLLEANISGNGKDTLVSDIAGNTQERMANYTLSSDSVIVGIDNTFAVAPLKISSGQNESIWKKVYRG